MLSKRLRPKWNLWPLPSNLPVHSPFIPIHSQYAPFRPFLSYPHLFALPRRRFGQLPNPSVLENRNRDTPLYIAWPPPLNFYHPPSHFASSASATTPTSQRSRVPLHTLSPKDLVSRLVSLSSRACIHFSPTQPFPPRPAVSSPALIASRKQLLVCCPLASPPRSQRGHFMPSSTRH